MTTTGLPTIDYTSRDYASFRASMLAYASAIAPEWKGASTGDPNDLGVVLIEAFAYEGDVLSYYLDRLANESFLSTATQRSSVLSHAALLSYTPRSATAASAEVEFTVTAPSGVTLPAGFQVSTTPDDGFEPLIFELQNDLVFPAAPGAQVLTATVVEGETVTDEILGTSCGDLDATFTLSQTPVIADSVIIRVVERPDDPGQVWFPVNNLLDVAATDNAFSYFLGDNDSYTIRFGDDVSGRVPPRGAVIHARYRVGGGADGNVDAGTITDIIDPSDILLPSGGTIPVIDVTNPTDAAGGTDSESLESIRANVPKSLRTARRAVSLTDFEALALNVPGVQLAKAKAVGQVYTNITLFIAPPGGATPTNAQLNAVVDFFADKKMGGVTVVAATPQYVGIDTEIEIIVDPRYNQALTRAIALTAVQDVFDFDSVSFGGRVALADIYTAAQRIEGVSNVVISKLARAGEIGATDIVLRDNELPMKGDLVLRATGGVVNSGAATLGSGTGSPSAATAVTLDLLRCDPNSTHIELHWTAGANTTTWDISVAYLNASDVVVQQLTTGPYTVAEAAIDLPLIGAGRATKVSFTVRAYNGNIGPTPSAPVVNTYICD